LVDFWFARRLIEVLVIEPPRWRYPFSCDLRWDAVAEQWSVGVVPGWCESPTGDASPTVTTLARLCPPAAQRLMVDDPEAKIVARLDEGPRFLIANSLWRAEGTDGVVPGSSFFVLRSLPDEIVKRGVLSPTVLEETETGLVQRVSGLVADRNNAALARAVEIYLEHGREVVSLGAIASAGAEVDFEVSFLPASPATARIGVRKDWPEEPVSGGRWAVGGAGVAADEGIDRVRIATLWLTSPRGEPQGSEPDERWTPYVEQRLSRNVAYEVTGPEIRAVPPLRLSIPGAVLAGGAAASLIGSFAGDLQNRADELDSRLAGTETSGRFVAF
jgi:hypothetical protein